MTDQNISVNEAGTVQALLSAAINLHRAGHVDEAAKHYAAILQADPRNSKALSLFGTLNSYRGRFEEAVEAFDLSLKVDPRQPFTLTVLGDTLRKLKRQSDSVAAYEKAIAIKPDHAAAHLNLAETLSDLGRSDEALASYDRAIALKPGNADAHVGRGKALATFKRYAEALESYTSAIELAPDNAAAYLNRGVVLATLNRTKEAGDDYDKSIALNPGDPDAHKHAGDLCCALWSYDSAVAFYDNAVALRPDFALAYHMRAYALRCLRRYDEALESSNNAIEANPELSHALGERLVIQMNMCSWDRLQENTTSVIDAVTRGALASVPFSMLMIPAPPDVQRKCAELTIARRYPPVAMEDVPIVRGARAPERKIRVAYVSADYHPHPVARHLAGLIERHDPTRFETIGVALTGDIKSDIRERVKAAFTTFVEVNKKSDDEVAAMLRDMGVDIAIDLTSFTTNGRPGIFARRAAPIQVNYLGYPGTTGASYMDYMIADKTVIPEGEQPHYSEKIAYLPDTYIPNDRDRVIGNAPSRAELGLPEDGFVFCSINNSYKFTPEVFDIWMRLMSEVENSVLWLPQSNAAAVRNLDAEAEARGIAANRLVYATYVARSEDHLARLGRADLFLDTLPYNAHSTACEAIWSELPVLTCLGKSFAGRVAASVLYACGLPELVTHSLGEYEARARALALNPSALAEVKAKIARNRLTYPLFDTTRFARNLEAAYTHMWKRYENGDQPETFAVEAADQGDS